MVGRLLLRGMIVGLVAGLVAFAFARLVGEGPLERAIAFEDSHRHQHDHAGHDHSGAAEPEAPELVSRAVQSSIGLLTAILVEGAALGGMFAIAFAFTYGRLGRMGVRATTIMLAAVAFAALTLVPGLKYPANPPSVGSPDTIGIRTQFYFVMLAASIAAAILSAMAGHLAAGRWGAWNGTFAALALFVVAVMLAGAALPQVDEVPNGFPASLLWEFRMASLATQMLLWIGIGLGFGSAAESLLTAESARLPGARSGPAYV